MTEWGIDTLFNPGKRHMDEEKRRLQSTREEIGDSSGGRRIDLESGVVRIARRQSAEGDEAETTEAEAPEAEAATQDDVAAQGDAAAQDDADAVEASEVEATDNRD